MSAPFARLNITSLGKIAVEMQQPLHKIRRAAAELGITPHTVNGIPHFDADDVERIDSYLRTGSESGREAGCGS